MGDVVLARVVAVAERSGRHLDEMPAFAPDAEARKPSPVNGRARAGV